MNQSLEYHKEAFKGVKTLQQMNVDFHQAATSVCHQIPELEIDAALAASLQIDGILANELEEIGAHIEQIKATQGNAQQQPVEDSFTALFGDLIANLENRADLFGNGNALTVTITQQTPEGDRSQSVTIG